MKKSIRIPSSQRVPSAQNTNGTRSHKDLTETRKLKIVKPKSGTYSKNGTNDLSIENEHLKVKLEKTEMERDVVLSKLEDIDMVLRQLEESEEIRKQQ